MRVAFRCAGISAVLVVAAVVGLRAQATADAELQLQLATLLFDESRYHDALAAFDRALRTDDRELAGRARQGKIRSALRVGDFGLAREEAQTLRESATDDGEVLALYGDSLWASGRFDDADRAYVEAHALAPRSSRALFGRARTLATLSRLPEALDLGRAASAAAPRDGEIHAFLGEVHERMNRYDEAAQALRSYINLLPNNDRSQKALWARAQVTFLESFAGVTPLEIDADDRVAVHTIPFRLVNDKVVIRARVNGARPQDFVLDTGSEETIISGATARRERVRAVAATISAGVGEIGIRGLELGRLRSLELGTLTVRNVPVLIKTPALRNMPRPEGESFSPLAIGFSVAIDYEKQVLTMAANLPDDGADYRLPMRMHRLAMVKGMVNDTHPAYFVVDTGGEVISISADTAQALPPSSYRRIPLRVWGTSGWDRDAFLLPGLNLDFESLAYRNVPLVVLNLRAPSVLLGFQLGGIVGHRFLAPYRVSMDLARSELRLQRF